MQPATGIQLSMCLSVLKCRSLHLTVNLQQEILKRFRHLAITKKERVLLQLFSCGMFLGESSNRNHHVMAGFELVLRDRHPEVKARIVCSHPRPASLAPCRCI